MEHYRFTATLWHSATTEWHRYTLYYCLAIPRQDMPIQHEGISNAFMA